MLVCGDRKRLVKKKKEKKGGLKKKEKKKKKVIGVTNNMKEIYWRSFANFFFLA